MEAFDPSKYPAPMPHDSIEEILDGVYLVRGSVRMAPLVTFSRNMVVVRDGRDLTVVSAVRLSSESEAELDRLGRVRHVVRIGYFHGLDDRYYVDGYGAEFWSLPGAHRYSEPQPTRELSDGGRAPFAGGEVFAFRGTTKPEAALLVQRDGGLLVTCDSVQHYEDWRFFSLAARLIVPLYGFSLTTLVGPIWLKEMTPPGASLKGEFERLLESKFRHLVAGHGSLCRNRAHEALERAVTRAFPK